MQLIAQATIHESDEYQDVTLRISTVRGSFPILIVEHGVVASAETIGTKILAGFSYMIQSEVFNNAPH